MLFLNQLGTEQIANTLLQLQEIANVHHSIARPDAVPVFPG